MRKVKMKRVGVKLDMTPMVDVAFLLLTFFMLTTQFKAPETIPIELPSSHAEVKLPVTNLLMVTVAADGTLLVGAEGTKEATGGQAAGEVRVQPGDLQTVLETMRAANPSLRTVIKADRTSPYGAIEDVMESIKEAQITRFALITDLEKA